MEFFTLDEGRLNREAYEHGLWKFEVFRYDSVVVSGSDTGQRSRLPQEDLASVRLETESLGYCGVPNLGWNE